jgi:hypothetical protein
MSRHYDSIVGHYATPSGPTCTIPLLMGVTSTDSLPHSCISLTVKSASRPHRSTATSAVSSCVPASEYRKLRKRLLGGGPGFKPGADLPPLPTEPSPESGWATVNSPPWRHIKLGLGPCSIDQRERERRTIHFDSCHERSTWPGDRA